MPQSESNDPRGFQISQIKKRFSAREDHGSEGVTSLAFKLIPSDPDFPFEMSALDCLLKVPREFPEQKPSLRVTNKAMDRGFQVNVECGFDMIWNQSSSPTLLNAMKALDRQLEALLTAEKAEVVKLVAHTRQGASIPIGEGSIKAPSNANAKMPADGTSDNRNKEAPKRVEPSAERREQARLRREAETRTLESRFSRRPNFSKEEDGTTYQMPFEPRKRSSLPSSLQPVKTVRLSVPQMYDWEPCTIELIGVDGNAAAGVEHAFVQHSKDNKEATLLAQINNLAQNIHAMVKQSTQSPSTEEDASRNDLVPPEIYENSPVTETSHVKVIPRPLEWSTHVRDHDVEDSSDSDLSDSDSGDGLNGDNEASADEQPGPIPACSNRESGVALIFPALELYQVELLILSVLNLSVKCSRCKETTDLRNVRPVNSPGEGSKGTTMNLRTANCRKCAFALTVGYRADLMHPSCHRAGYLDADGCTPLELLPSSFQPTCATCSTTYPADPGVTAVRGDSTLAICRQCHAKMFFKLPEVKFQHVGGSAAALSSGMPRKKPAKENLGIVAGTELPRRGVCSHYRRSARWFRFSCCGKVYPCDKCHDEEEKKKGSPHVNEFANRMICGYCSREQNYRPETCGIAGCGRVLTGRSSKGGFWEGGKGTRDRVRMSRKDPRKFKRRGPPKGGPAKTNN